nr:peptidylprolyl isomerase [uncultured Holophaga sp.]
MKRLLTGLACAACLLLPVPLSARVADPALFHPEQLRRQAPSSYRVRFETTQGSFTVKVHREWAPQGADRFYNLVTHGFYDGCSFFRVLPGFVVQWGIHPDPGVARAWSGANIGDDRLSIGNLKGRLTFATAGPNTRTTQLFINLADNRRLDAMGFTPFAEVEGEGLVVVRKLYAGYGEGAPMGQGPDQDRMEREGDAYLHKGFPKLDRIRKASLVK